ncbi:glycoside hydrolase family 2 protein [Paenibacillus thermotolerans]|uniref:glycoside hydrolase family 2 protein n=1 Tax=Paenibacillus thermotolerans TaxID=3027807 RepID=UPI002368311C|nr:MULTISPECIES: sugar-binding domain-containing protein [unclassified Paenibacillus]
MHTIISLNGDDWLFKDFVGEDWIWRHSEKPDSRDVRWWRQGTVPGSVHHDLLRLSEIPDPYFERNSLLVEWVPQRTWIYKKRFRVGEEHRGKRIRLVFKGIDYEAHIYLNGERLGSHAGMYTPAEFDIEDRVSFGEDNLLAVVIEKAPDEQPQVSKTRYVRTHKSRMTYWWDFCPRMIHIGIWDDVYLKVTGSARLDDVFVRPLLSDDCSAADVSVSVRMNANRTMNAAIDISLLHNGSEVASHRAEHVLPEGETGIHVRLPVDAPRLWWPNGIGDADLYEARVKVSEAGGGAASDERIVTFGIRKIELVRNETEDESARPYTFVVNGFKVYIKGWNWVPIDAMYGVDRPAKLERLLTLAKRANVNMLRVWGGGLIEKDAFYEWCDRLGIMVWQEFIQSSSGIENKPSDDPAFIDMMVREAEQIIPRKRNHPSLALWCGGNELQGPGDTPLDDNEPVLGALRDVVARLDPDRHWLPTSPTGRVFMNSLENIEKDALSLHDVHGPWEHQGLTSQYTLYNRGASLLHSEFGVEGMTNRRVLDKTISKQHQWPAGRDNPVYFHRGSWWNNEKLVQESFGGIEEVGTLIKASQFMQAEGLRYAVEANLRRQFQSSGTLPWQFNEPFPNAYCTSAIDYYAEPKAVYYAVSRAYGPVHVSARFDSQVWAGQDRFAAEAWAVDATGIGLEDAMLTMGLVGASGKRYSERTERVHVPPNGSGRLAGFTAALADVDDELFFLDITLEDAEGALISTNRYLFSRTENLQPMLTAPETILGSGLRKNGDVWDVTVTNSGSYAALDVRLEDARDPSAEGYAYFEDNCFSLFPGESRTVRVEWSHVDEHERKTALSAWNTAITIIQ